MLDRLNTYGIQPSPFETRELPPIIRVTGDAHDVFPRPPVRREASRRERLRSHVQHGQSERAGKVHSLATGMASQTIAAWR